MKNEDEVCVFCEIVEGTREASIVYEDELTMAFVDLRQFHAGHTLVIPRRHIPDVRELDDATGAAPDSEPVEVWSRAEVSFDDADGNQVKIETISTKGNPTLIFVTYDKPDGPLMVMHELRASLKAEGVKLD
jgi:Scavenger mRNA decapping enzyme C-term binding